MHGKKTPTGEGKGSGLTNGHIMLCCEAWQENPDCIIPVLVTTSSCEVTLVKISFLTNRIEVNSLGGKGTYLLYCFNAIFLIELVLGKDKGQVFILDISPLRLRFPGPENSHGPRQYGELLCLRRPEPA